MVSSKRHRYNSDGLEVEVKDALGSRRELAYDDFTRSFVSVETVWTETGPLRMRADYDTGRGVITKATDFNGHTSTYVYDGLGRLTAVVGPLDSVDTPLQRFAYVYGTPKRPISVTTTESLVDRAKGVYRKAYAYADGLGRARETKTEAEAPFSYVASGWQRLSPQGKPTHVYQSFPTAGLGLEAPPEGTPVTVSYLDAEARAVKAYPPAVGGKSTYTATTFLPFETQVYDERDTTEGNWKYPAVTRVDGLGRVVEQLKHNDYDGHFTQLRWRFDYDAVGNITAVVDPKGHRREYSYDSLSRKRRVVDANAGQLDMAYDDVGNLLRRVNAVGQQVTAEYGLHGRLVATRVWEAGAAAPLRSYEFGYDVASDSFKEAKNLLGQVAWVSDAVSKTFVSYDEMGRAVTQVREVWNPATSSFEAQQRDVFRRDVTLDAQGKPMEVKLPGGFQLGFGYNERNLVKTVEARFDSDAAATPVVSRLAYDAQGSLIRSDYGNATTNCCWCDVRRRVVGRRATPSMPLTCLQQEVDASAFQQLAYRYTVYGLLEVVEDTTPPRPDGVRFDATYQYDRLYELTGVTTAEGTVSYRYDGIQNLVSQRSTQGDTGLPLGDFLYGEGKAGPNALTKAGRESFSCDAAGRMLGYHGFSLEWDGQDKLLSATKADGTRIENYYGFDGERLVEVVRRPGRAPEAHRFVFDGYFLHGDEPTWVVSAGPLKVAEVTETAGLVPMLGQLDELVAFSLDKTRRPLPTARELLDVDGNGTTADAADVALAATRYWTGVVDDKPRRVWRYYREDQLGAPTHTSDSKGEWTSASRFHAYGRPYGARGEKAEYGCAGSQREPLEELGLVRMGARWYAPDVGRWVTADSLPIDTPTALVNRPLNLELYSYAHNSPTMLVDRTGHFPMFGLAGAARTLGGAFEVAAGLGLAAATGGLGTVAAVVIVAHGLDQMQAGARQMFTQKEEKSFTQGALEKMGVPEKASGYVDAGIGTALSMGGSLATVSVKVAAIRATDPLAKGLSAFQIVKQADKGARALTNAEFGALGGRVTTDLAKAKALDEGAKVTTTFLQRMSKATELEMLRTGPTAAGNLGLGAAASGGQGAAAAINSSQRTP